MATAMSSDNDRHPDDQSLESFCLIWLDGNPNEGQSAEPSLRSIINELKKFQDVQQCQDFIQKTSAKERFILIASGRLGREILPTIHSMRQVISVYIYCMDKKVNELWSSKYSKVKGVITNLDELVSKLTEDQRIVKKLEEPFAFYIFAVGQKSTSGLNGKFVVSQILIDSLLRLKSHHQDQKELMELLKQQYHDNPIELEHIKEFERKYHANEVLQWYTKDCFFSKTLNSVLRTENAHFIFLYCSFISDIQQQLQNHQSKQILQVYRAQIISQDELDDLKKCRNQFISINSFVSATESHSKALSFFHPSKSTENTERVLFQIEANPNVAKTKPFAKISQFSEHPDDEEVLFMVGSIFRLQNISFDKKQQIWIVEISLSSNDDDNEFRQVRDRVEERLGSEEAHLRDLGEFLSDMRRSDLDETHVERLLNELLSNNQLAVDLSEDLAKVPSQSDDANKSTKKIEKPTELKQQHPIPSSVQPKEIDDNNSSSSAVIKPTSFFTNMKHKIFDKMNRRESNLKWKQIATTIAGGNGRGLHLNRFSCPHGIYVDNEQKTIYVADYWNQRVVKWKLGETSGTVAAGGKAQGQRIDQLSLPTDMVVDHKTNDLFVCDWGNKRIVRCSLINRLDTEIIIPDIKCWGLRMNDNGDLFVSDCERHEVERLRKGEREGVVVAGGNGKGSRLNQLNYPTYIFIDRNDAVYISDKENHRVMKWEKGAKEGIVVAGGYGQGNSFKQLDHPQGVSVNEAGDVYVADTGNHRIMCWPAGSRHGRLVVGGNGKGPESNQLSYPRGLAFDGENNLCVVDENNQRIQRFDVDQN